jgi:hypothetical protein
VISAPPSALGRRTSATRKPGASVRAIKALADALEQNPHVPAYLTGKKRIPSSLPPLIGMGDEDEAIAYAHVTGGARRLPLNG